MHNTSSQLFKYTSRLILEYFNSKKIHAGEKYSLYLESQEDVNELFNSLKNSNSPSSLFSYTHPNGKGTFETFSIAFNDANLIIASSAQANEDYLTTLRNQVSDQKAEFENTAILILFSGKLDSLLGGSESLLKEGLPLHAFSFQKKIEQDIQKSSLKPFEKTILTEVLLRKANSVIESNTSILDFGTIISCLESGSIGTEGMNSLGLFPSQSLQSTSEINNIKASLEANFNIYEEIENIHLHGNPDVELERKFPEIGKTELIKDTWKQTDFTKVQHWIDDKKSKEPPVIKGIEHDLMVSSWIRDDGNTTAQQRSKNILIFNPNHQYPVHINIRFDQPTRKEGIKIKEGIELTDVLSSGNGLTIVLKASDPSTPFTTVEYRDTTTSKVYKLKFLLLPFDEGILRNFETNFIIQKQKLMLQDEAYLEFNPDATSTLEDVVKPDALFTIDKETGIRLKVDYDLVADQLVPFSITLDNFNLPLAINPKSEPLKPITGLDVWKDKRQLKQNFKYVVGEDVFKLKFKNNERTVRNNFRTNLLLEKQLVDSQGFSWMQLANQTLEIIDLNVSDRLKEAFNEYRSLYVHEGNSVPSLVFLNEEFTEKAKKYVNVFLAELSQIHENAPLNSSQKDLAKFGVVYEKFNEGLIKFTPFHPINVAYQLALNEKLNQEEVYEAILKRLNPINLIPLLSDGDKTYVPIDTTDSPEWLYFSAFLNSQQAVPKSYISDLVNTKLKSFIDNYNFLFSTSNLAPIKINVINLGDCKEVLQGFFEYYRTELNRHKTKRLKSLVPIDITIYGSDDLVSAFEELTYYEKIEEIESNLGVNLKTNNYEKEDLVNTFLEKIHFYSKPLPIANEQFEYAHITFYQFDRNDIEPSTNKVSEVKSGMSLSGLIADVPSVPMGDVYKTGFGAKGQPSSGSELVELTKLYNALVGVASNSTNFERDKALSMAINVDIKQNLDKLYDHSQWVTYIDPKVDLDFFKEKDDLVIIHYSDQFNNSSGYDAITVSNKTEQYANVITEFLDKNKVETNSKDDALSVVNFFNAINGDWLLKLIKQDSQFPREKISLLSGIKSVFALLNHPNIIWTPISLEEILRVSGGAGLKKSDGLFSTKNLASKERSMSDDLLMIGLEKREDKLYMHLYPVELKIGGAGLATKGIEQGENTANLLKTRLTQNNFLGEFYRNFFGKLVITNAEKLKLYKIWENNDWDMILGEYRSDLMNDNFWIATHLKPYIGEFGVIHFNSDATRRTLKKEKNFLHIEFLEEDGYRYLVKGIDELETMIRTTETGLQRDKLLINTYLFGLFPEELEDNPSTVDDKQKSDLSPAEITVEEKKELEKLESELSALDIEESTKEGIKVLFGQDVNHQKDIIWEPNNTDKVMHSNTGIIGTMGTGKTQFTKSLIYQMIAKSDQNIGNQPLGILIFDYKGDYIKADFVNATNAKVFDLEKLPYNPLALDYENPKPKLPLHTASAIKETISTAYNLGTVQKIRLQEIIMEAYEQKGISISQRESWSKEPPTIADFCDLYLADEKVQRDSLYAALMNLSKFEIFEPKAAETTSLYELINGVTVINLSGYDESIQNLIVAITLDAFYTQMQVNGHSQINGNMRQLRKMILVDEADNFLSKNFNSIKKILKEGREFGVGTVLSTQFLNHFSTSENDYSNYILTWVIHRVNEIKAKEVDSLFSLKSIKQRDELIKTIKNLEKHHSIVNLAGTDPVYTKDKAFWELIK